MKITSLFIILLSSMLLGAGVNSGSSKNLTFINQIDDNKKACEGRPQLVDGEMQEIQIDKLPKNLFVAKNAEFYFESIDSAKIHSKHLFHSEKSTHKVLCLDRADQKINKTSVFHALMVLDLTQPQTQNHVWQFELGLFDGKYKFATHNSDLLKPQGNLLSYMKNHHYQFYKIKSDPKKMKLVITQKNSRGFQQISILFDIV